MPVDIQKEGQYELFCTTNDHRILVLDGQRWLAWVDSQQGELLVGSDSDHKKQKTLQKGDYYLVDFNHDPKFKNMPHLFLQDGGHFDEMMLPHGLPTKKGDRQLVVDTGHTLGRKKLEDYLENPRPAGEGEERMSTPGGGSISNVTHHLKGIGYPKKKSEIVRYAKNKNAPKAVIDQLEKLPSKSFDSMADVTRGIGEKTLGEEDLAIANYSDKSAREVIEAIER